MQFFYTVNALCMLLRISHDNALITMELTLQSIDPAREFHEKYIRRIQEN